MSLCLCQNANIKCYGVTALRCYGVQAKGKKDDKTYKSV